MRIVIDDDGFVVGVGDDETRARQDAVSCLSRDWQYLEMIVDEMQCEEATDALVAEINRTGGETPMERLPDGRFGLRLEAAAARREAEVRKFIDENQLRLPLDPS